MAICARPIPLILLDPAEKSLHWLQPFLFFSEILVPIKCLVSSWIPWDTLTHISTSRCTEGFIISKLLLITMDSTKSAKAQDAATGLQLLPAASEGKIVQFILTEVQVATNYCSACSLERVLDDHSHCKWCHSENSHEHKASNLYMYCIVHAKCKIE